MAGLHVKKSTGTIGIWIISTGLSIC